jgi:spore maturation protein CgeB
MKVLFSSYRYPHFKTFTDYIEKAFKENGCHTTFFENRSFIIPGRIRDRVAFLQRWDLERNNKRLLDIVKSYEPDLFLEAGGLHILPKTVDTLREMNIKTALWTIDAPRIFEPIREAAPHYDFVFTGGSEAYELLKDLDVKSLHWLPFACDPGFHRPVALTKGEREKYSCDICFVGSGWEGLYPYRRRYLEALADFDLGIWGPGWETLPSKSPLKKFIRGGETRPEEWIKIFSAAKIIFHSHYRDPNGKILCYQVAPRVYEALACEGFLIVDRQPDVLRFFESGKDLVVFDDLKGLQELVKYYLQYPNEAEAIAARGREKVLAKHTYSHRIKEILAIVMVKE